MDMFDNTRPPWIRGKAPRREDRERVESIVSDRGLNSVCVSAACPNKGECWKAGHVTFMILGDVCTRGCLFCNIDGGVPSRVEPDEPGKIAAAVKELGVKYAVITSVTRDDLADKGTSRFFETVKHIKNISPETRVELLIPDLDASESLLQQIAFSGAEVIGHNIEMPERFYASVRPRADYRKSLRTLSLLAGMKKRAGILVKSSLITGLGEIGDDINKTLNDLKGAGVDIVYIGQYLSPTKKHWPVKRYYTPEEFSALDATAKDMGFKAVMAGPMVRSSYRAYETYERVSVIPV